MYIFIYTEIYIYIQCTYVYMQYMWVPNISIICGSVFMYSSIHQFIYSGMCPIIFLFIYFYLLVTSLCIHGIFSISMYATMYASMYLCIDLCINLPIPENIYKKILPIYQSICLSSMHSMHAHFYMLDLPPTQDSSGK